MSPYVKSFLQNKKWILLRKAQEAGIETTGTKIDLAKRLANFEEKRSIKYWAAISQ